MVAIPRHQRLNVPAAVLVGALVGAVTAFAFLVMPTAFLESLAVESGIAAVLSAAEPPLGFTARMALVFVCGGGAGVITGFAAVLLLGTRPVVLRRAPGMPAVRRADAHPDAPPRAPVRALSDLGTPFLEVRAPVHLDADAPVEEAEPLLVTAPEPPLERDVPADLDQPLSAYDPAAIPDAPLAWESIVPASRPQPKPLGPGERIDSFSLPVAALDDHFMPLPEPVAIRDDNRVRQSSATIHALLDRLERSVPRRVAADEAAPRAAAR